MDEATIHRARSGGADDQFSEVEALCLQYAERMTAIPVDMEDDLFDKLRQHFTEEQLVELTAVIAWENFRARFNHAFGLESDEYYRSVEVS